MLKNMGINDNARKNKHLSWRNTKRPNADDNKKGCCLLGNSFLEYMSKTATFFVKKSGCPRMKT
jgi:hypothetical protein